jgi:glycosyltransferase involved in cell wall biosynthesis
VRADRPPESTARVACVYQRRDLSEIMVSAMNYIRFFRMAEALARRGHEVDIVMERRRGPAQRGPRLREIPFELAKWSRYDAVKTFFHTGSEVLREAGGDAHPFVISKLGSVVGRVPTPGVHFFGKDREELWQEQERIAARSRVVTILTKPSIELWKETHGPGPEILEVPTGVDAEIPPPGPNPYAALGLHEPVVLYAGLLYTLDHQREVNLIWQDRLNRLGHGLRRRGLRLVVVGPGVVDRLDPQAVIHAGPVEAERIWDWQRHARVGLVLAQGPVQDNESSKIYYYLRTGLPVVCERPVPNSWLITKTDHGRLVDYDDVEALAEAAAELAGDPPRDGWVADYMAREHSWDVRAAQYDAVLARARRERGRPA